MPVDMDETDKSTTPTYNVASMDREHFRQLSLFNDLKAAVRSGADDGLVYALLNDLIEHTDLHFLSEQLAMKLQAYEASESHFLEHRRLLAEVRNLKHNLSSGTAADKCSLIESLLSWLRLHIETSDKAFAEYLHAQGSSGTGV